MKVAHQIQLGSDTYRTGDRTRLLYVKTAAALDVPVNAARLAFSHPEQVSVALGDVLEVEIGHDGYSRVFTGEVSGIDWRIDRVEISGLGSFKRLSNTSGHHYFDKPTSADIVNDLAARVEVQTSTVETGLDFPSYALGSEQSYYQHLKRLAFFNGFLFYADQEDQLVFSAPSSFGLTPEYKFGETILQANIEELPPAQEGIEVFGSSPASLGQGADSSHWFAKKAVKGSVGGREDAKRFFVPAARTTDIASSIAQSIQDNIPIKRGKLKIIGDEAVALGASIRLSGLPTSAQNSTYTVASVSHHLHPQSGFITTLEIIELP